MTMEPESTRQSFRTATVEALMIATTAALISMAYGGIMGNGLFAPRPPTTKPVESSVSLAFEDARALFLKGDVLFVDARHSYDFGIGHIRGAISVPLQEFDEHHPMLEIIPKDRPLIVYCDGAECNSSKELALKLKAAGYTDVKVFFGGWTEWVSHDQPRQP